MHVQSHHAEDQNQLERLARQTSNAKQRDRYRAVLLALAGHEAPVIAMRLGRSRRFVQRWVYVYRDEGMAAIAPRKQSGRPPKLSREQQLAFKRRMLAGPRESDGGVCTLRGKEAQRILQSEFGQSYSLNGAYELLHRLDMSCLQPRPRHRKQDAAAQAQWLDRAPFLSGKSSRKTPQNKSKSGFRTRPASVSKAR